MIYFNAYGRGEPIRLLLNHAGATFKDERIEMAQWPEIKPNVVGNSVPNLKLEDGTSFG